MTAAGLRGDRQKERNGRRFFSRFAFLPVLLGLVAAVSMWAVTVGTSSIPESLVLDAILRFDGSREHIIIIGLRVPRVLAGLLVGAALAVAGAIMQAITNNPLASPGLFGINAGAAFAVVLSVALFGSSSDAGHAWFAFGGAALAAVIVFAVGSAGRGGATPLKLAIAGAVLSSFLTSLTSAILIFDAGTLDDIRLWSVGSLSGRTLAGVAALAPYIGAGLAAALLSCRQIMTLSLGPEVARSVGQNLALWRGVAAVTVTLLAGAAVALAGPIGFVGLVAPHVIRLLIGADYRWIIPYSALCGALLVVLADAAIRAAFPGTDLPVGVTMALIGAPFFIYLARYRLGRAA